LLEGKEKLQRDLANHVPRVAKSASTVGISTSGVHQYAPLKQAVQHMRVDGIREFEQTLELNVDLIGSLSPQCIDTICGKRLFTIDDIQMWILEGDVPLSIA
jgi:hypothetical protein